MEGKTQEKQQSSNAILNSKGDYLPSMIIEKLIIYPREREGERE